MIELFISLESAILAELKNVQLNQQLFVPLKKRCKTQAKGLILFKLVLIDRGSLD